MLASIPPNLLRPSAKVKSWQLTAPAGFVKSALIDSASDEEMLRALASEHQRGAKSTSESPLLSNLSPRHSQRGRCRGPSNSIYKSKQWDQLLHADPFFHKSLHLPRGVQAGFMKVHPGWERALRAALHKGARAEEPKLPTEQ